VKAVDYLTNTEGVVVISSSLGFSAFEADGTSKASKAVDAARAAGVSVTISAGNDGSGAIGSDDGEGHFSATFADSDRDGFHDFAGLSTKKRVRHSVGWRKRPAHPCLDGPPCQSRPVPIR